VASHRSVRTHGARNIIRFKRKLCAMLGDHPNHPHVKVVTELYCALRTRKEASEIEALSGSYLKLGGL
jgi:hypothetical protein